MSLLNLLKAPVNIFLSRHGEAYCNLPEEDRYNTGKYDPSDPDHLTPNGEQQAAVLGDFLRLYHLEQISVNPMDVLLATSAENRSIETGDIVNSRLNIPFCRTYSTPMLNEKVTKELTSLPANPTAEDLRRYRRLPSNADVYTCVCSELESLIGNHKPKVLIALLHGNINSIFLHQAGIGPLGMGNCSLLQLRYKAGSFEKIGDYLTNDQLRAFLENE